MVGQWWASRARDERGRILEVVDAWAAGENGWVTLTCVANPLNPSRVGCQTVLWVATLRRPWQRVPS